MELGCCGAGPASALDVAATIDALRSKQSGSIPVAKRLRVCGAKGPKVSRRPSLERTRRGGVQPT